MAVKGGKTVPRNDEQEIQNLLNTIDELDPLAERSKQAKLDDVNGEIIRVEADLVGLRRMLVQHGKPMARINESETLATAITDRARQLERLRRYRNEIQLLPDDEAEERAENDRGD
jgi:hypothetical protein